MVKGKERDEAVRRIVQLAANEMGMTNEAYDDRRFLENRQHYGALSAFVATLQELGANIDFKPVFEGDLVRVEELGMENIKF